MRNVLLDLQNVTKMYGNKEALKDVSFQLYQGEIFSLLGVNGTGKTTLSSILATLQPPTSGNITMGGVSIYDDLIDYRRKLGFCPQKPNFETSLTVEENLIFAGRYYFMSKAEIKEQVRALLDKFELTPYASANPSVLSGGYKQRLLIARALIHNPLLIILDEPTVGLDPHIRRELWDIIKSLKNNGVTVVLTTHYLDEAQYLSDRICILERGHVLLIDTLKNLISLHAQQSLEYVFLKLMQEKSDE